MSNTKDTTEAGFVNRHGQIVIRKTELTGTDHLQHVYQLSCVHCGAVYGANGSEIHERLCPECQEGRPGLALESPGTGVHDQKWPDQLVIVRHGQSERNVAKERAKAEGKLEVWGDHLRDVDTPLTPLGIEQAATTGQFLRSRFDFDAIFVSPYLRTIQTAEQITAKLGGKPLVVHEERIREIEFGILDGLTRDGIQQLYPVEFSRREREGKYWYRPPGGESRPDVALRVHSFLGTLTREYRRKSVLVVCHSVVVLIFRRLLERWDEAQYMKVDSEDDVLNCSITAYRYHAQKRKLELDCFNTICYPREMPVE
jgi:broad specificity phosphatase PhoE